MLHDDAQTRITDPPDSCACKLKTFYAYMGWAFIFSGIGRGIAIRLAQCGAQVIALSRTQEDLDSLKQEVNIDTI